MTPSERDHVAVELRKINERLGGLVASQSAHGLELAEIKARVKETNGRVTKLEAQQIANDAVAAERRRSAAVTGRRDTDLSTRRDRLRERTVGAAVTISAVILGALLADVRFF